MRKLYLKDYKESGYGLVKQTINFDIQYLWSSFDYTNNWILVDEDDGWVTIRCMWDMKTQKWKDFISLEEKKQYDEAYAKYWWKNWEEIPKLEITKQNYDQVLKEWERLKKSKAPYGIISIDNMGWVRIEGKDKLDQQDLQDLKEEHQKYLNYKEKWDVYKPFTWKKNEEWESETDSQYYSDYLTEEEMVWKKKKF